MLLTCWNSDAMGKPTKCQQCRMFPDPEPWAGRWHRRLCKTKPQAVDEGVLGQSAEVFGMAAAATMGLVCFLDYPDHDAVTSLRDRTG